VVSAAPGCEVGKELSGSGVTEALVNAADAWSDAEVAYLNERLNRLSNDPQTKRTILLGADTVKMRGNGFEDTMGLGLERVFRSEHRRAKRHIEISKEPPLPSE
jgi:hypothetical protein